MGREWQGIKLPKGVEVRTFNGRQPTVGIRFTYRNVECRELALDASTPKVAEKNIAFAAGEVARIRHMIELGKFVYGEHFPESKRCELFNEYSAPSVSVKKILDDYLEWAKPLVSPGTHKQYTKLLANYVRPGWDNQSADKLTQPNMLTWLKELAAQGTKGRAKERGLSKSTARTLLAPFKLALAHAVTMKVLVANPLHGIKLRNVWPKAQRNSGYEAQPFTADERAKILKAATPQMRDFLTFWWFTGLRCEEIIALKWDSVNFDKCRIRIDHVTRAHEGRIKETKTEAGTRDVPLLAPALKALQSQRARTQLKPHGFVFETEYGKPWTQAHSLNGYTWVRLLKAAGVAKRGPYQCRHTFASIMISNGEPIPTISKILGHKNPAVTLSFYTRMIEAEATHNVHGFDIRGNYERAAA